MKKLILSTAIVLGVLTAATAQTEKEPTALNTPQKSAVEDQVETQLEAVQDADVQADVQVATVAEAAQDYKEVKSSEVPQAVKAAVAKDFDGSTISKAYVNAKGEYKLELASTDAENADAMSASKTVYATSKGEWLKNDMKKQ